MATRICPHCGEERQARGFHFHIEGCKEKHNPLRERYALQIKNMLPEQAGRFLRKAGGG